VGQGGLDQFAHLPRRQALGGRIDRLDGGDVAGLLGPEHVRVDDLHLVVEALDLAGDDAPAIGRMAVFEAGAEAAEEHQADEPGLVERPDPPHASEQLDAERRVEVVRRHGLLHLRLPQAATVEEPTACCTAATILSSLGMRYSSIGWL